MKKISIILLVLFCSATQTMDKKTAEALARKAKHEYKECPYRCAFSNYQRYRRNDPAIWELCKKECHREYQETIAAILRAQSQRK